MIIMPMMVPFFWHQREAVPEEITINGKRYRLVEIVEEEPAPAPVATAPDPRKGEIRKWLRERPGL